MRIGILADIHEDIERLAAAIKRLRVEGADAIVALGDVIDLGRRDAETVALLSEAGVAGVWGNHEFALCVDTDDWIRERFSPAVLAYMATLRPRLELGDCLFSHTDPCLDPGDPYAYYVHEGPPTDLDRLRPCLEAVPHRRMFVGHFHRWRVVDESGPIAWEGSTPLRFHRGRRSLTTVAALCDGHFALLDTEADFLLPLTSEAGR